MNTTQISKWGNSLAVRIPANIVEKAQVRDGDAIEISISKAGKIVIERASKERNFSALYRAITPENKFGEIAARGVALGAERVEW
jgi:antitoxin MazE